jgi:hypothetical protein
MTGFGELWIAERMEIPKEWQPKEGMKTPHPFTHYHALAYSPSSVISFM